MLCGCQMKKAEMEGQLESIDSPFQVRLIKFLGLHSIILQRFVFRRKKSTYSIKNVDGSNTITINGEIFQTPNFYRSEIDILETENHSVPVVRIYPLSVKQGQRPPCIVYAHGNSSDLGDSLRFISQLAGRFKAEFVAFDYTGYGESRKQNVGEDIICKDLQIVLSWLKRPLSQIILWGFSLGTFPVVFNAAKYQVKAAVLQCPIGSLSCMFYEDYQDNIKFKEDHFANIDYIANIKGRILMMHSTADEIIPIQQARLLYNKYTHKNGDRKIEFIEVEKIKHNSLHRFIISKGGNQLQQQVFSFLALNQRQIQKRYLNSLQIDITADTDSLKDLSIFSFPEVISSAKLPEQFEEKEYEIEETFERERKNYTGKKGYPIIGQGWPCNQK